MNPSGQTSSLSPSGGLPGNFRETETGLQSTSPPTACIDERNWSERWFENFSIGELPRMEKWNYTATDKSTHSPRSVELRPRSRRSNGHLQASGCGVATSTNLQGIRPWRFRFIPIHVIFLREDVSGSSCATKQSDLSHPENGPFLFATTAESKDSTQRTARFARLQ